MGINSRNKGNRNERMGASLLTTWTKRKFERTPSSGGLQWRASFSKGDVVCTKEGHYFPFCVEIKAHKEIDFSHLLRDNKKGVKVLEFWDQCKRDADKCNKIPMLMMRYDGMPKGFFFLAIPTKFYFTLTKNIGRVSTSLIFLKEQEEGEPLYNFIVVSCTDFFTMPYKTIKLAAKTYLNGQKGI